MCNPSLILSQVLLLPTIFSALNEKTLYIFGGVNFFCILMVWALYPESNQRTLEEMDLVFASDSPWVWDAEKNFAKLKAENPDLLRASIAGQGNAAIDPEKAVGPLGRHSSGTSDAQVSAVADVEAPARSE